jgi:tetratricopeptide (TPR) repeat protein
MTAQPTHGLASTGRSAATQGEPMAGPVRSGPMPPLAAGFVARPETVPGLSTTLVPGGVAVLAPSRPAPEAGPDWLGVCGKTQLAAHFAESLWRSREVELLVWVTATSRASVLSGYVEAAAAAIGSNPGDGESVAARFVSWLAGTSRPWLVVLDDLSDAADLAGLWPVGASGRLLITTRNPGSLPAEAQANVLSVGALSQREALGFLMGRLTADLDQRLGGLDLVKDLGCEPLALAQASAVIAESTMSCRDYRGHFARRREQLPGGEGGALPPAAVTWTFAFEQAGRQSSDGAPQALLALAALLDGHGIPGAVFTAPAVRRYVAAGAGRDSVSQEHTRDALLLPARAGLLEIDTTGGWPTIWMSSVVQEAIRVVMPAELFSRAVRAAADALLEVWPGDDRGAWVAGSLRSCAGSLQQVAGDRLWEGGCHPLLLQVGRSLENAGLAGPAVAYWRELITVSDRILGRGHPDTLVVGEQMARSCLAAGRAADAVPWFQWVLTSRVRALGPDHSDTIEARRSLGRALAAAGKFDEAITVLDGALGDYDRTRGPEHLDTLGAREELADAYAAAGQVGPAIQLSQLTLKQLESRHGSRHPDTMATRQKLADAFLADGRAKDAIAQYKRTLADRERALGADHLDTIGTRARLGSAYQSAGKLTSTLQFYEQARAGYERVLGPDHPDTLAHRASLAHVYYTAGRLSDATTLLRDTVTRCERTLLPGDPLTEEVRESLAKMLDE